MIYLLYGQDAKKSREKLRELVGSLMKKKPDASHLQITDESCGEMNLDELIASSGLFSAKMIVEFDGIFKKKDIKEIVVKRLKEIADSENIFVFLEGNLDKKTLEKFEKCAEKIQSFDFAQDKGKKIFRVSEEGRPLKDFNMFSITDAFGRRDRKNLWVLYAKAARLDVPPEEIHGLLFWQTKAMLLALSTKSAKEAGLNPFVYQKSLGFSKKFTPEELKKISLRLVTLYHDVHRGLEDFPVALEKFILEV